MVVPFLDCWKINVERQGNIWAGCTDCRTHTDPKNSVQVKMQKSQSEFILREVQRLDWTAQSRVAGGTKQ